MQVGPGIREFLEFEKRRWPMVVAAYHDFFEPVTGRVAEPLVESARAGEGRRVLDVATGPGYAARAAAARGASVVGVDFSPEVIALAARISPGMEWVVGDAHELPFAADSFDSVVANFLIPHLGDHRRGVSELVRVAKPGGRVAVSNWDVVERMPLMGLVQGALAEAGASPPPGTPTPPPFSQYSEVEGLTALLGGAGLLEVSVDRYRFEHRVPSTQALWDGVVEGTVRTSVMVTGQNAEMLLRIREAFEALCAGYLDGQEMVIPISVLIGSGAKPKIFPFQSSTT